MYNALSLRLASGVEELFSAERYILRRFFSTNRRC